MPCFGSKPNWLSVVAKIDDEVLHNISVSPYLSIVKTDI